MTSQRLAVIILSWNSPEDVLECVESVKKADLGRHSERSEESPGSLPVRQAGFASAQDDNLTILIVDNGSDAKTHELVSKIPGTTYLQTGKNLGFGGGNDVGIRWALERGYEYIMLLNQDTVVDPNCFEILVNALESDPRIGIAGPLIYDYHDRGKLIFAGGKLNWLKTKGTHSTVILRPEAEESRGSFAHAQDDELKPYDVDYVTGGALLARRELIEKIGLLPEEYFLYFEDVEWNWKAQNAGYRTVVVPQAKIWHKVSTTAKAESPAYIAYHFRNGLHFAWKIAPFWKKPLIVLWSLWMALKQVVKIILGYRRAWARAILRGLSDYWKGKRGEEVTV